MNPEKEEKEGSMSEEELFLMSDDLLSWAREWIIRAEQRG